MSKGGSKVLSFILGFLFAIILEAGIIFGVGYFFVTSDMNYLLNLAGIKNQDEEGKYIYVNTDADNDGVSNVLDLIKKIQGYVSDYQNLTLGEIDSVLPITGTLVGNISAVLEDKTGVAVDVEELKGVKFSELGDWVQEFVRGINIAPVLEKFGMQDSINKTAVLEAFVYGTEAKYVVVEEGETQLKLPVYYDVYKLNSENDTQTYKRVGDDAVLESKFESLLVEYNADEATYKLFHFNSNDTWYATNSSYDNTATDEFVYENYSSETSELSGYYYKDNNERIIAKNITLGEIMDDPTSILYDLPVIDILGENPGDVIETVMDGVSVGSLINGEVNFDDKINGIKVASVVGDVKATDDIMLFLCYDLTNVAKIDENLYSASYNTKDENGEEIKLDCFIETEGEIVKEVYLLENGERTKIESCTVKDITSKTGDVSNKLAVSTFIDVTVPQSGNTDGNILAFVAFSVTDVHEDNGQLVATYHATIDGESVEIPCFVTATEKNGKQVISSVYYYNENGEKVYGDSTKIADLSSQINKVTKTLKVKDVITIDQNDKFMSKIGEYKVNEIGNAVNEFELGDFMDIAPSSTILMYLSYSVTDIAPSIGTIYSHTGVYATESGNVTVYVLSEDNKVKGVYFDAECTQPVSGTTVKQIPAKIDGIYDDITLGELVPDLHENKLLANLENSTINSLSADIKNLPIQKIYFEDIYGVTAIKKAVAVVNDEDSEILFDSAYLYYVYVDGQYKLVNEGTDHAGKLDALEDGVDYYTYGKAVGTWKFMLYVSGSEQPYPVNNMADLMRNATNNISSANLFDLADAGIVNKSALYNSDGSAKKLWAGTPQEVVLGELTINGLINAISSIAS